jgi:hypothetical protein
MKHYPLVLICDSDTEKFKAEEHYFREIEGVPVTVVHTANLEEFTSKLAELTEQGNYPDILVVNASMRDSHRSIIEKYTQMHKDSRDGNKIEKELPSQIIFYSPRFEDDTFPPEGFQYIRGELREWWNTQINQPDIYFDYFSVPSTFKDTRLLPLVYNDLLLEDFCGPLTEEDENFYLAPRGM